MHESGNIVVSLDYFLKFNFPNNYNIIDIGCNFGSLINNIYNSEYQNVVGIDISHSKIVEGKKIYSNISDKLFEYDGVNIPFENQYFDVVMMFDVIEHIPNVSEYLITQVNRILKSDGIFIFQTPNKMTNIPWEIIKEKSFTRYKTYHCSLQTLSSLRKLLQDAGFKNITIKKNNLLTEYNIKRLSKIIGRFSNGTLNCLQKMPLRLFPNFWGYCTK